MRPGAAITVPVLRRGGILPDAQIAADPACGVDGWGMCGGVYLRWSAGRCRLCPGSVARG